MATRRTSSPRRSPRRSVAPRAPDVARETGLALWRGARSLLRGLPARPRRSRARRRGRRRARCRTPRRDRCGERPRARRRTPRRPHPLEARPPRVAHCGKPSAAGDVAAHGPRHRRPARPAPTAPLAVPVRAGRCPLPALTIEPPCHRAPSFRRWEGNPRACPGRVRAPVGSHAVPRLPGPPTQPSHQRECAAAVAPRTRMALLGASWGPQTAHESAPGGCDRMRSHAGIAKW